MSKNPEFDGRPTIRITNTILEHPKVVGLTDRAFRSYIAALCYCSRQETDGRIPTSAARVIGPPKVVAELISAGLLALNGDGYSIHDYLRHQRSAGEIAAFRSARSADGKLGAHLRWHVAQRRRSKDCDYCLKEAETG